MEACQRRLPILNTLLLKRLKRNKGWNSHKIDGLLIVSLDANEHFAKPLAQTFDRAPATRTLAQCAS